MRGLIKDKNLGGIGLKNPIGNLHSFAALNARALMYARFCKTDDLPLIGGCAELDAINARVCKS